MLVSHYLSGIVAQQTREFTITGAQLTDWSWTAADPYLYCTPRSGRALSAHLTNVSYPGIWYVPINIPLGSVAPTNGNQLPCQLWTCSSYGGWMGGCSGSNTATPSPAAGDSLLGTFNVDMNTDYQVRSIES